MMWWLKLAKEHLHPELSIIMMDATAYGSNYFDYYLAPEQMFMSEDKIKGCKDKTGLDLGGSQAQS